ncbi:transcription termination factor 3, mitochondrial isoform X1 [Syngnathus scovelli]|uniref:transcription termination factor 3, mitochondrial isoform X1 n=2 Tax=Syngnathus scovelli TaxID=161590 RepID=UPI0021105ABE|nr:transcription termination factor 3, mitochondrial isoform X1 [Syngnathus scovelli]XP_049607056.1 transcription termination factor 3, mitochondrial isoform X1 [Syngnathus scovelli]
MASFCVQLCIRHRLVLPLKTVALTVCTQARRCRTFMRPRRPPDISGTHTKYQQRPCICFYSNMISKLEDKESNQLIHLNDDVSSNESPTSFDQDAATRLHALEEISDEEAASLTPYPSIPPASASLREYVDQSEMLVKLVQLGVNLCKLEQRPNVGSMLLRLVFDKDVAPRLLFLKGIGVDDSHLGYVVTRNPLVLTEDLENLQARVNYLKSKKFTAENVASMVSRAPYLLNFSVKRLDNRLGFYQQQLGLNAANTCNIVARLPRLLCGSLEPVKENLKVCEIELGFKTNEIQHMVLAVPKILTGNKRKLTQIFDFLHNTMKVPHHLIAKFPQVFNNKLLRIKERHLFLQYLERAHYDPDQSSYVSLERLTSSPDATFCTEVALATLEDFYVFQKTL